MSRALGCEVWPALPAGAVVLVPVGSIEQHGPHLPLDTDTVIADAVGGQVEVVMDGGVRRGSDVVKALALGARAVMIGRAYLWGLAANGEAGVGNVLDVLRSGIDSALLGMGLSSIEELSADQLLVPEGFHRALDTDGHRITTP